MSSDHVGLGLKLSAHPGPLLYCHFCVSSFKMNSVKFPEHHYRRVITDDWLELCHCWTVGLIALYLSLSDPITSATIASRCLAPPRVVSTKKPMDSAAALGWPDFHSCLWPDSAGEVGWGIQTVYCVSLQSARLRRNSSVHKVYKFHSQQLKAAAQQPSKLYDTFSFCTFQHVGMDMDWCEFSIDPNNNNNIIIINIANFCKHG